MQELGAGVAAGVDADAADAFGDEHPSVIREGDVPRVLQLVLHRLGPERIPGACCPQDGRDQHSGHHEGDDEPEGIHGTTEMPRRLASVRVDVDNRLMWRKESE